MKRFAKLTALFAALVVSLGLFGCADSGDSTNPFAPGGGGSGDESTSGDGSSQSEAHLLKLNTWAVGTKSGTSPMYAKFSVTNGTTYKIVWEDYYDGDTSGDYYYKSTSADIKVTAYSSTRTYWQDKDNGYNSGNGVSLTAGETGVIYLRIELYTTDTTSSHYHAGNYRIGYNTVSTSGTGSTSTLSSREDALADAQTRFGITSVYGTTYTKDAITRTDSAGASYTEEFVLKVYNNNTAMLVVFYPKTTKSEEFYFAYYGTCSLDSGTYKITVSKSWELDELKTTDFAHDAIWYKLNTSTRTFDYSVFGANWVATP